MRRASSGYGLWTLVVLNSALFLIFAFSFIKPHTGRDWHNSGHLGSTSLCEKGDPHFGALHIASYVSLGFGFYLLFSAWNVLPHAQRRKALVNTGHSWAVWTHSPSAIRGLRAHSAGLPAAVADAACFGHVSRLAGQVRALGHSAFAPWHIVHADDKRLARLNLMRDVLSRLPYPGKKNKLVQPDANMAFEFTPECIAAKRLAR